MEHTIRKLLTSAFISIYNCICNITIHKGHLKASVQGRILHIIFLHFESAGFFTHAYQRSGEKALWLARCSAKTRLSWTSLVFSLQTNRKCTFHLAARLYPFNPYSSQKSNNSRQRRAAVYRDSCMLQTPFLFFCCNVRVLNVARIALPFSLWSPLKVYCCQLNFWA